MNERTRQLVKQAGIHFHKGGTLDAGPNGIAKFVLYSDIEKFAELLVQECADVLIENGDKQFDIRTVEPESHTKTTDWMEGYEEAVKHYGSFLLKKNAKLIKKHFGVEE